jgi:hypothetical protein
MEANARTRKKWKMFRILAILAMGIPPLVNSLGNPRLAGLRGPDVLRLIAIGFCVGVAFALFLVEFVDFRGGRGSS